MIQHTAQTKLHPRHAAPWSLAGALDEHCRDMLDRLGWPSSDGLHALRTLGVTSCRRGEGVTTVAAHLAIAAASRQDQPVVLVDADLSRPSAYKLFGLSECEGLAECVCNGEPPLDLLQPTGVENLYVLSAGKVRRIPARVYDSANLHDVVGELSHHAALTVFDLPPAGQVSCATRVTAALDGVLMVIEAEGVAWESALRVRDLLTRAGARIVGGVLNKRREPV